MQPAQQLRAERIDEAVVVPAETPATIVVTSGAKLNSSVAYSPVVSTVRFCISRGATVSSERPSCCRPEKSSCRAGSAPPPGLAMRRFSSRFTCWRAAKRNSNWPAARDNRAALYVGEIPLFLQLLSSACRHLRHTQPATQLDDGDLILFTQHLNDSLADALRSTN